MSNEQSGDSEQSDGRFAERFEDLRVWQDARVRVRQVYRHFLGCRDYAFRDQIQRAALSVMNNIAEGFERRTAKDFAHFLDLAKGSAGEVRSMTYAAEDLEHLGAVDSAQLREDYRRLSCGIAALTRSLRP